MSFVMHIVVTTGMLEINPEPRREMPIKFKPTQKTVARGTKVVTTTHYYIKSTPLQELIDEYNKIKSTKGKGKLRQKISNEFARRKKKGVPYAIFREPVSENG